jgi:hypothetical protein
LISPLSLFNAQLTSITIRILKAAWQSQPLSLAAVVELRSEEEQHQLIPAQIPIPIQTQAKFLQDKLQHLGPTRSVLLQLLFGALATLLATNALNPLLPTTPTPISAKNALKTRLGQHPISAVRNSQWSVLPAKPTILEPRNAKSRLIAKPTKYTTKQLETAIHTVLQVKLECARLSLPFGMQRLFIAKNVMSKLHSGIQLLSSVKAVPTIQFGT